MVFRCFYCDTDQPKETVFRDTKEFERRGLASCKDLVACNKRIQNNPRPWTKKGTNMSSGNADKIFAVILVGIQLAIFLAYQARSISIIKKMQARIDHLERHL
ncbi:MAG: hypothetical protein NVSMB14_11560 [Isosphaeraceae bacterium]